MRHKNTIESLRNSPEFIINSASRAEKILWNAFLRKKRMGVKFFKHKLIGQYIVDFCSPDLDLIIEIRRSSKIPFGPYARRRQCYLENLGYKLLSVNEKEIIEHLDEVHQSISQAVSYLKN